MRPLSDELVVALYACECRAKKMIEPQDFEVSVYTKIDSGVVREWAETLRIDKKGIKAWSNEEAGWLWVARVK